VRVSLIFAIIVSFMLFTVFPLVYVLYFEEFLIHDSRGFMKSDFNMFSRTKIIAFRSPEYCDASEIL